MLSLLAFDGGASDAPVRIAATAVGGDGGGGDLDSIPDPRTTLTAGDILSLNGRDIWLSAAGAVAITLPATAIVGFRIGIMPGAGVATVSMEGGAGYWLPPTDTPASTARTTAFVLSDYTEFKCVRQGARAGDYTIGASGNAARYWVLGVPAGLETTACRHPGPQPADDHPWRSGPDHHGKNLCGDSTAARLSR